MPNENDVCCSGGAPGADLIWGEEATKYGHSVIHFTFRGHRTKAPKSQLVVLDENQLELANEHVDKANKTLKRTWPVRDQFVGNLLRRDYYQVVMSDSLYAVSTFDQRGEIKGGTAWAIEMMKNLHPYGKIYLFDQKRNGWAQWKGGWFSIIKPPRPAGIYAGVGSRDLNSKGERAIREVFE